MRRKWNAAGILGILLTAALAGCASPVKLKAETYTLEVGEELSAEASEYAEFSDEKLAAQAVLLAEQVDTKKVGSYNASISLKDKEYPFTIEVVDTKAPETVLKTDQILVKSASDIKIDDFLESVTEVTEYFCGFRNPVLERSEARVQEDLRKEMEMLEGKEGEELEKAKEEIESLYEETKAYTETIENPEELSEKIELEEDGQYLLELVTADSSGNASVNEVVVFLDSKPPVVEGNEPITVDFNELEDEKLLEGVTAVDNMFGDLTDCIVWSDTKGGEENAIIVQYLVADPAGNETLFEREIKVNPASIPRLPSLEEVGLVRQEPAGSGAGRESAPASKEGGSESSKENAPAPDEGEGQKNTGLSEGHNRAMAEEAFALVNQQRAANGMPALGWNESLYGLACTRAQEIVSTWSHDRPNGENAVNSVMNAGAYYSAGENIAKYTQTAAETVNAWMNSQGHRENILESIFTQGCIACYCHEGRYYWVNLFNG